MIGDNLFKYFVFWSRREYDVIGKLRFDEYRFIEVGEDELRKMGSILIFICRYVWEMGNSISNVFVFF